MMWELACAVALSIVLTCVFFFSIVGVMYLSFSVTIFLIKKLMAQWNDQSSQENKDGYS